MDRINGLYTIENSSGKRIFQNKNLAAGISGTQLDAGYMTDQQEELIGGLIEWAGEVPTAGADRQVQAALTTVFASAPVYLIASANVTVPLWATRCAYRLWGAGASGAVGPDGTHGGGGGGSGGYCEGVAAGLTAGQEIPVTIGVGGPAVGAGNGLAGGTTSFGSYASATGGAGGSSTPSSGGPSGGGTGGSRNEGLGDGFDGATTGGGHGGGPGGRGTAGSVGAGGVGAGGGGGGTYSGYNSGRGHDGLAILEWLP